jgi:uncharacterized protein (TIGR03067 family)
MKTNHFSAAVGACVLLVSSAGELFGQSKNTPPPFPGWANKMATPGTGAATTTASVPADNRDIIGVWEGALVQDDGSNPGRRQMSMSLTITPDKITSTGQGGSGEGTYKISNGGGKFRHIDATGTAGQYNGKHYQGIISVEGNTLKWCSGNPGSPRPSEMRTNPPGSFLMVLTRKQGGGSNQ